jgi:Tfp pilus assembly protein PilN
MIRINLLSLQQRRGNRISASLIAAALAAAVVVSGAIGWFGLVWFGDLGDAEARMDALDRKMSEREKRIAYYTQLEVNRNDYLERVKTIQEIGQSRRQWCRYLDELIDVVNTGNTDRHVVWFDSIAVKSDVKGATMSIPASVQGDQSAKVANFHDDLDAAPFIKDLVSKSDPTWRLEIQKDRMPPASMVFPLVLQFLPSGAAVTPGKPAAPTNPPATPPRK